MQALRELARQVERVHETMAETFTAYQKQQGLVCRQQCSQCCQHPHIHASTIEMLPLALHLYDTGQAEAVLDAIEARPADDTGCHFLHRLPGNDGRGYCTTYQYRPAICRIFGVAGYRDKYGATGLSVCQPIREDRPAKLAATLIDLTPKPPQIRDWKIRVTSLDHELGKEDLPINEAARQALLRVLMNAQFGEPGDKPSSR